MLFQNLLFKQLLTSIKKFYCEIGNTLPIDIIFRVIFFKQVFSQHHILLLRSYFQIALFEKESRIEYIYQKQQCYNI